MDDTGHRLRMVIKDAMNFEYELVQELENGKLIKRFKVLGTNVSYKEVLDKVKECVEKDMGGGLSFKGDILHSSTSGIKGFEDVPDDLRKLIERRVEMHYKSEEVDSKKKARFAEAAKVINDLSIDYQDVVRCFVNEIEIIASGRVLLDDSRSYPGIDLTINAVDMECVGRDLCLDTSGRSGGVFRQNASHGIVRRSGDGKPRGDKGYDGYDGEDGSHAGNIIIKVENTIINLGALKSIKANGGNGGEGQLGGDGDEGSKGLDGKDGVAKDTDGMGGGQTNIGFGSPGLPGGRGGRPGLSGRPGRGGHPGDIDIEHKAGKVTLGEMNPGKDADNILDKCKPKGGKGGKPGLYGLDEVLNKDSFFYETVTKHIVVDKKALITDNPGMRDKSIKDGNLFNGCTANKNTANALKENKLTQDIGFIWNFTYDSRLNYKEVKNPIEYRDRDKDNKDKRGKKYEKEAKLRSDTRHPHKEKRDARNMYGLHRRLSERKREEKEQV